MNDTARDMIMYDAQKKSVGVAYLLWFFVGYLGGHRFYAGKTGTAIFQLLLTIFGACTVMFGIGFFVLGIVGLWILVKRNLKLIQLRTQTQLEINTPTHAVIGWVLPPLNCVCV